MDWSTFFSFTGSRLDPAVDKAGAVVPTAADEVSVSVSGEGRLLALDDDDQYTNLPFDVSAKKMRGGRLLAIVRLQSPAAKATLSVRGPLGVSLKADL